MASKNDIQFSLGINSADFVKGMKAAQDAAEKSIKQIKGLLVAGAGILGFALTARELGQMIGASVAAGKQLNSLGRESGLAEQDIMLMTHALDRSGQSMESTTDILTTMRETLREAEAGSRDNILMFERLGISVDEFRKKAPPEQFALLAERLNNLSDPIQRASLAAAMLGSNGAKAVAAFQKGDIENAARLYGRNIENMAKGAAALAQAHDAWQRITGTGQEVMDALVSKMAPALEAVANRLQELIPNFIQIGEQFGNFLMRGFNTLVGMVKQGTLMEALKIGFELAVRELANLMTQAIRFTGSLIGVVIAEAWDKATTIDWKALWDGFARFGQYITGVLLKAFATPVTWLQNRLTWFFEKLMAGKSARSLKEIEAESAKEGGPKIWTASGMMTADQLMGKEGPASGKSGGAVDIAGLWAQSATNAFSDPELKGKLKGLTTAAEAAGKAITINWMTSNKPNAAKPGTGPGATNLMPVIQNPAYDSFRRIGGGLGTSLGTVPQQQLDVMKGIRTDLQTLIRQVDPRGPNGASRSGLPALQPA